MTNSRRRVVITGMGVMSPLGKSVEDYWSGLIGGKSGIGKITLCDTDEFPADIAGEVDDFDAGQYANPKEMRRVARFAQMAVAAAATALENSRLNLSSEDGTRLGVVMGNGNGGFPTTEANAKVLFDRGAMRMSPFFVPMILPNMAAAQISRTVSYTHLRAHET